jgi:hypothetical protein
MRGLWQGQPGWRWRQRWWSNARRLMENDGALLHPAKADFVLTAEVVEAFECIALAGSFHEVASVVYTATVALTEAVDAYWRGASCLPRQRQSGGQGEEASGWKMPGTRQDLTVDVGLPLRCCIRRIVPIFPRPPTCPRHGIAVSARACHQILLASPSGRLTPDCWIVPEHAQVSTRAHILLKAGCGCSIDPYNDGMSVDLRTLAGAMDVA